MPTEVQERYLVSQFHKKNSYKLLQKNSYTKKVINKLRDNRFFIKDIDKVKILNCDKDFILNGAAAANRRVKVGRRSSRSMTPKEKISVMTEAALFGDYICSYHIAQIYSHYKRAPPAVTLPLFGLRGRHNSQQT